MINTSALVKTLSFKKPKGKRIISIEIFTPCLSSSCRVLMILKVFCFGFLYLPNWTIDNGLEKALKADKSH